MKIPDSITRAISSNFTIVPNEVLRNPNVSAKAKIILGILLSNKVGWQSHRDALMSMMKEKETAIQGGLTELKELGYLIQLRYRDKSSKKIMGMVWAYTDTPYTLGKPNPDFLKILEDNNLEFFETPKIPENHNVGLHSMETTAMEYIYIRNKKTKGNNTSSAPPLELRITPSLFETFWRMYPNHDKKGEALSRWKTICNRVDRPLWIRVRQAIRDQKNTDRWKKGFIPLASTWLNQSRWLDDPKEMNDKYTSAKRKVNTVGAYNPDIKYQDEK